MPRTRSCIARYNVFVSVNVPQVKTSLEKLCTQAKYLERLPYPNNSKHARDHEVSQEKTNAKQPVTTAREGTHGRRYLRVLLWARSLQLRVDGK